MRKALNRAFSVAVLASAFGTCAIPVLANDNLDDEQYPLTLPTPAYLAEASQTDKAEEAAKVAKEVPNAEISIPSADADLVKEIGEAPGNKGTGAALGTSADVGETPDIPSKISPKIDSESRKLAGDPAETVAEGISQAAVDSPKEGDKKEEAEGAPPDAEVNSVPGQVSAEKQENAAVSEPSANSDSSDAPVTEAAPSKSAPEKVQADTASETKLDNSGEDKPVVSEGTSGDRPDMKADETAGEKTASESVAVPGVCLFGGVVKDITANTLAIMGTASNGEPLELEFIVDEDSELAVGMKKDDRVVVYYEETEQGGYRVTSARYVSGDFPRNVFPADLALQKAEAERKQAELKEGDDGDDDEASAQKVVSIEVEGNSVTTSDEILKVVSTRVGDPILDPRIRRDMQAVYDTGYFTDVRLDTRYAPGGVRLVFRVLENPVVQGIELEGNKVADTETLLGLMQTEPGKVLNTRVLQSDLQAINKYYNDELNYTVSPSHITGMEIKDGILHLTIIDGIVIEKVEVNGVTVFPQEMVDALITSKPGDLFNRKKANEDANAVAKLYEKEDYLIDNIRPTMDPKTGVMAINVTEAMLEEIKIVGTVRTKDDTILRNLRTKPGEVMRRNKIQKDMERLNRLGLFKKVEPELEPGSEPGKAIMTLNIEEQKTGLATIGVGYAGGGSGAVRPGITGAISFSERNLFGEGKSISVNLQQGAQIGSYGISYYDPAINAAQDSIGVNLYYNNVTELQQAVDGADSGTYALYDQRVYGGTFTYGHPINDDLRLFATLRHDHIKLKPSEKSMYEPVGMGEGDLNSISLSALYDTRDDLFSPHHGAYGTGTFTYAGNLLGGKYDFMKFVCEGRYYIPVTERCTVALRGMYGIVGDGAPASEYFYAGGTDTMRAYRDNFLYGTQMFVANAEFRFPIFNIKMLNGAVFVDAGNAWSSWSSQKGKVYADAGVGLRIVFPTLGLGVIRLDYAHGSDGGRCSIGIGQSF
ncbi:MAG: BamA/TamA family outer membrane protein [bacterium]|nr:BamA/TamA family outer membrane protein [bacterium]